MLNHVVNRFIDRQRWLEPVADVLQKIVGGTYKALGEPGHALKTFVHGTWLGHPLHPVITDIPLGAWTLAVLFDVIYLFRGTHGWVSAADLTIFVGLLAALGAAVTGYTDWNETVDRERRVGIAHGLLNTVVIVVYLVSLIIRVSGGSRGLAIVLGIIGSIIGGAVTHMFSRPANERYHPAGLIFSILGAILVLFLCYKLKIRFPHV